MRVGWRNAGGGGEEEEGELCLVYKTKKETKKIYVIPGSLYVREFRKDLVCVCLFA